MKTLKNTATSLLIALISMNMNAQGVVKKPNEEIQNEGCIEGDCKEGYGVFIYPYGDRYIGNWKDGKQNGQGTWVNPDTSKTVGNWKDNFQDGVFEVFNINGEFSHKETWVKGKLSLSVCESGDCENGWGTFIWLDGNMYEGNWKSGKQHGAGNLYWFNGDTYFGDWKNNIMDGIGTYMWKDGRFYKGEYTNGKMNGKGKFYSKDSLIIKTGTWIDDVYQVGETGCISGDCENGYGTYLWEDGNKYEGEWENSKMDGTGTLYLENGEIHHKGKWENHQKVD